MKFKLLLVLSLTLNVVTVWFLIDRHSSQSASVDSPTPVAASEASREVGSVARPGQATKVASTVGWTQALRDAGVSEKVIADVVAANFEDRWHRLAEENQRKFDRGEIDHAALMAFDLEHDGEQEKELRAALGDEGYRHWDQTKVLADFGRTGVQLSAGESDKLYEMRKDLDRKRLELDKARQQGKLTDEEAASQSAAMYAQYNQQLLKVLGDDRYAQTQSGGDTGIAGLKRNLHDIKADDSEVAGLETAQQTWNSQRSELDLKLQKGDITAEDYEKQMKALEAQRDQQYQQVLGADGFAALQRNQNEQYQTLKRIGPDIGFTDDDINNLYASIETYQNGVRDYRDRAQQLQDQGQTVDWPGVEKVLQDFSQQTENALRDKLGDKFDKLKRSNVMPFER
jgi:hypothetical protein